MNGLKQDERGPERNGNINVLIQALLTQLGMFLKVLNIEKDQFV